MVTGLVVCGVVMGPMWLLKYYVGPYLGNNLFFIMYTFLHHNHVDLPHYTSSEWTFLRGALSTVDRDYGIMNHLHHRIGSTHVCHHLFSQIPHYHAEEASQAIQKVLGKYYVKDTTNVWFAMYREFCKCKFVASDESKDGPIMWYYDSLSQLSHVRAQQSDKNKQK